jgi:capsular exopolysaccharide synthesis family protein
MPARDPVLISADREAPLKDAYRRLRAAIHFAANTAPIRSLMITSATAGEGKSTTAANLAVATALQGRRVILVDADLRGSSLAAMFGVQVEPGLSDILTGQAPVHRALHPTGIQDLLLVPAGSPAANASELLAGPRMRELVEELTGMADLVIVDTPPCLPVADAEVLGSQMDAAALVIGLGQTEKEAVRMARDLLEQAHVRVLGAVINRMKAGDHRYYYRYRTPATVAAGPQTRRALPPQASAAPAPDRWRQENEG